MRWHHREKGVPSELAPPNRGKRHLLHKPKGSLCKIKEMERSTAWSCCTYRAQDFSGVQSQGQGPACFICGGVISHIFQGPGRADCALLREHHRTAPHQHPSCQDLCCRPGHLPLLRTCRPCDGTGQQDPLRPLGKREGAVSHQHTAYPQSSKSRCTITFTTITLLSSTSSV